MNIQSTDNDIIEIINESNYLFKLLKRTEHEIGNQHLIASNNEVRYIFRSFTDLVNDNFIIEESEKDLEEETYKPYEYCKKSLTFAYHDLIDNLQTCLSLDLKSLSHKYTSYLISKHIEEYSTLRFEIENLKNNIERSREQRKQRKKIYANYCNKEFLEKILYLYKTINSKLYLVEEEFLEKKSKKPILFACAISSIIFPILTLVLDKNWDHIISWILN